LNNTPNPSPEATSTYARIHGVLWKAAVVVWATLIFDLSTRGFGGSFTEWLLRFLLNSLHITVSAAHFEIIHHLFRKLAHMTEYAILAMLLYGSAAEGNPFRWRGRRALWCIVIAGLYSLTDEFHQSFVPGRGPSLIDCGIDTTGATAGILIYYLRHRLFPGQEASNTEAGVSEREVYGSR
jgi:VanZ family protein